MNDEALHYAMIGGRREEKQQATELLAACG
jgi:hypothetical protein